MLNVRSRIVLVVLVTLVSMSLFGQVPEPNVNMVAGTEWPGGDPFLQRQNEGSLAVSTRNPLHLLAGANDYRTVDLPGLDNGEETGDAWLGVFKSFDGGQRWRSTLLPGYPQEFGSTSPLHGFQAAADPVVRAGANGMFYFSGIVLNRDAVNPLGALFVARFIDNNNLEAGDPIAYLDTRVIAHGAAGQFIDKPWMAVAPGAKNAAPCTIGGHLVAAQSIYVVYTVFIGAGATKSNLMFVRSADCGATWSTPTSISGGNTLNQGASIAFSKTGKVIVVWRRFQSGTQTNAIMIARSSNDGRTFAPPKVVAQIDPFEQGTTITSIRTNAYPAVAVDDSGRLYVAWSQRGIGPGGDARIVIKSTTADAESANDHGDDDGGSWTPALPLDLSPFQRGHQFMPALAVSAGKLLAAFYDLREDHSVGIYQRSVTLAGHYDETRIPEGDLAHEDDNPALPPAPAKVFTTHLMDQAPAPFTHLVRRHTIDVRAVEAPTGAIPLFHGARVSHYTIGSRPGFGTRTIEQLQFNPPNFPMFALGHVPFFGDYIDLTPVPAAGNAPVFHAVWTDNRDVRPPADGDWTHYTPPQSPANNGTSKFDVLKTVPACSAGFTGSRNQNIYTSRISDGLFAGAPGNAKPLGTIQRAFAVFVQNATNVAKSYRLTIPAQPANVIASFTQFAPALLSIDVPIAPRSSATRTVFVTSPDPHQTVNVQVTELAGAVPAPNGLTTTVVINPDVSNPDVSNPDVSNPDVSNPDVSNTEIHNPDVSNPDVSNPDVSNPDVSNPDVSNPDVSNPDVSNPDITTPDVSNPDVSNPDVSNPDVSNPDVSNPDVSNGSVSDTNWTATDEGNTTTGYNLKLATNTPVPAGVKTQLIINRLYRTPIAKPDCTLAEEVHREIVVNIVNPHFTTLGALTVADPNDASFLLAPGESIRITLRVFNPFNIPFDPATAITPVVISQASNVIAGQQTSTTPPSSLFITTAALPVGVADPQRTYNATVAASGGTPPYTWTIVGPETFSIAPVNGTTAHIAGTFFEAGTQPLTVTVTDSATPVGRKFTRTFPVTVNPALSIATQSLPTAIVGIPYSTQIVAVGGIPPYTFDLKPIPDIAINPQTGVISGTPLTPRSAFATVTVTDSETPPATATAQYNYSAINSAINGLTPGTLAAGFGQLGVFSINLDGIGGLTMTFSDGNFTAPGFIFTSPSSSSRLYVRLPFDPQNPANNLAIGPVTATLLDANAAVIGLFTFPVSAVPGAPVIEAVYDAVILDIPNCPAFPNGTPTPTTALVPGGFIAIAALGTDTVGAQAEYTQGNLTVLQDQNCALSGSTFGLASTFPVPQSLVPGGGDVTIRIRTQVNGPNGPFSAFSAPVTIPIIPNIP